MGLNTKEIGKMTFSMVMEWRLGQMDQGMKAIIRMERNMEWGPTLGVMVRNMLVTGMIIK